MSILDYFGTNHILVGIPSRSKKQVIEDLAERAETVTGLSQRCLLDIMMRRERLGSTGIGDGIAIPHAVHGDLTRTIAFLAILKTPIDFGSVDDKLVDIVCLVLGPPNNDRNHLNCISSLARSLQHAATCDELRAASSPEAVLQSLQQTRNVAA
jgi:PTS system nitrogen regulatory IIA component